MTAEELAWHTWCRRASPNLAAYWSQVRCTYKYDINILNVSFPKQCIAIIRINRVLAHGVAGKTICEPLWVCAKSSGHNSITRQIKCNRVPSVLQPGHRHNIRKFFRDINSGNKRLAMFPYGNVIYSLLTVVTSSSNEAWAQEHYKFSSMFCQNFLLRF